MSGKIVLLWLGTAAAQPAHEPDLASWADSRIVTLEEPSPDGMLEDASAGDSVLARIETLLADARTASYADPAAAETALSSAELLLRGNPALPAAPWLMAEACRAHAAIARAEDPALAEILEARAIALEGPRAVAFGEGTPPEKEPEKQAVGAARKAPGSVAPAPPEPARSPSRAPTPIDGPLPGDDVEIDGVSTPAPRTVSTGEHHVRILRRGRLAWAGWVTPDDGPLRIPLPAVAPCSDTDFSRVRLVGDRVETTDPIACPSWAVARENGGTEIVVARCAHSECSTLLPWSRAWGNSFEDPVHPPWPAPKSQAWIPWTILSVAAAAAGGIVLWRTGAFDREGPARDTVTFTGPSAH